MARESTSAEIGANFSDYTGNDALGGANVGKINIDTRPLEQLAQYTYYFKRDKWNQLQKETDGKIAQLADLSNISLNDLVGKDKEQGIKEFADLQKKAAEYARKDPKTPQEKIQNELDWQTAYGAFKNNYGSGKARAVTYHKLQNDINAAPSDAKTKDVLLKQLQEKFDSTDIGTPISAMDNFPVQNFEIPEPTASETQSEAILGNDNLHIKRTYYSPKQNSGKADAIILGIGKAYPKQGSPEYNNLSETEKKQAEDQSSIDSAAKGWLDAVIPLNEALSKYRKDGVFDESAFKKANASNSTVMNAYDALKNYSAYNQEHSDEATAGVFNDKNLGISVPANVKPDEFAPGIIDFANDVTPNQLVQSGMFAKFGGDTVDKKLTPTGDANEMARARLTQQGENYRKGLDIAKDKYVANLPYTKQKLGAVGADGQPIDFGNLIYGVSSDPKKLIEISKTDGTKLSGVKINNGVIVDKQGNVVNYTGDLKIPATYIDNSLITEFNKYAGTSKIAADGSVTTNAPSKLLVENGKYTVRMVNGEIQGIQTEGTGGETQGSFATADQFQHITLEAGQKGATKYKKADTNYGKFDNTKTNQPTLSDAEKFLQRIK